MNKKTLSPLYLLTLIIPIAIGCYWLINNQEKPKLVEMQAPVKYIEPQKDYSASIRDFDLILTQSYNPIAGLSYRERSAIENDLVRISKIIIDFDPKSKTKPSEKMEASKVINSNFKELYQHIVELLRDDFIHGKIASYEVKSKCDYYMVNYFNADGSVKTLTAIILAGLIYQDYVNR